MFAATRRSAVAAFATIVIVSATSPASADASAAIYEPAACPNPIVTDAPEFDLGPGFDCGYLIVPEDRIHSSGRTIRIPVARLKALSPTPKPDPIVFLAGGSGGSGLLEQSAVSGWNTDRDVIFISQRGTLKADPFLSCPEIDEFTARSAGLVMADPATSTASAAATTTCRARHVGQGWDLSDYNTTENASDIADAVASERVTLRQCLNHSSGWLGDDEKDFGQGDDALARFVASLITLPQLTPPGTQFAYNNVALDIVGRVIELVTGRPYEVAVRELLLDPLGLESTRYFADQLPGYPIAGSHIVDDARAISVPDDWYFPRNAHPDGGLISTAHDQLRYARFLMDGGRGADGTPVLRPESLLAMRSDPGPGGTLIAEIDGYGITLCLRRSAEGVTIVEHGGDYQGSAFRFHVRPRS